MVRFYRNLGYGLFLSFLAVVTVLDIYIRLKYIYIYIFGQIELFTFPMQCKASTGGHRSSCSFCKCPREGEW